MSASRNLNNSEILIGRMTNRLRIPSVQCIDNILKKNELQGNGPLGICVRVFVRDLFVFRYSFEFLGDFTNFGLNKTFH